MLVFWKLFFLRWQYIFGDQIFFFSLFSFYFLLVFAQNPPSSPSCNHFNSPGSHFCFNEKKTSDAPYAREIKLLLPSRITLYSSILCSSLRMRFNFSKLVKKKKRIKLYIIPKKWELSRKKAITTTEYRIFPLLSQYTKFFDPKENYNKNKIFNIS